MGYQKVLVDAWVFDGVTQPPLGIWGPNDPRPSQPIHLPPQGSGQPPLGIWGPTDPRPGYGLPDVQPPLGIWGPTDPRPGYGLPGVQPPLGIWGPTDPRPGYGLPGVQPPLGIWGPTDPRPGYGLPEQPPGTWGGGNVPMPSPPIHIPDGFPIIDVENIPDHAEVPDLNAGSWVYVDHEGVLTAAFVPWPMAVNPLSHNPSYPPEEYQPGEWVVIYLYTSGFNGAAWAWIPTTTSAETPPTAEQLPA